MKKLFTILLFALATAASAQAQITVVTGTATDSQATPYILGTWTANLKNTSTSQPIWQGSTNFNTSYSGSLDNTGAISVVLPSNTGTGAITVGGLTTTQWTFSICALDGSSCFTSSVTITGASQSITASLVNSGRITFRLGAPNQPPCGSGQVVVSVGTAWGCGAGGAAAGSTATVLTATESGNVATITVSSASSCVFNTDDAVNIAGVSIAAYNENFRVQSPGCNGTSSFTVQNFVTGLGTGNGGIVTGPSIFSGNANVKGLLITGGQSTSIQNFIAKNLLNLCGSSANPVTSMGTTQGGAYPCTGTSAYYGGSHGPSNVGYVAHATNVFTSSGIDADAVDAEVHKAICGGDNSSGYVNDNSTNCVTDYITAVSSSASSRASPVGLDALGQSLFTGIGTHIVQAQQNLSSTSRCPGWFRDPFCDYSPMNTATMVAGSQNITSYFGTASSATGKGALIGEFVSDAIQVGHAVLKNGSGIGKVDTGYWCASSTTACFYATSAHLYPLNDSNQPTHAVDEPTYSFLAGEKAVTNGVAQPMGLISTNASGTTFSLATSPTGAIQGASSSASGFLNTYTTTVVCSFTTGQPITVAGVTETGYNGDFIVESPGCNGTSSFTAYGSPGGIGGKNSAIATITQASESGGTVTITTSATCPFVTNQWVNIQNVNNPNPMSNTGYNGYFQVLAPGCNGGSTFQYTNSITGLATQTTCIAGASSCQAASYLAPSGGGTVTGGTRQVWTLNHTADGAFRLRWCNTFPCVGTDKFTLDSNSNATVTGNITSTIAFAVFSSKTANPAASGIFRVASADAAINFRNNANGGDVKGLSKDANDIVQVGDTTGARLVGPLYLNEVSPPSGVANVALLTDNSTDHTVHFNSNNNGDLSPSGSWSCTNVTPVTLPGTSTTGDQNLMACTIPAGTLNRVGRTLRVKAKGVYSTPAASVSQMTVKLKLCTVSGCGSGTVITPINIQSTALGTVQITNDNFSLRSEITTQTAGASSAYEASGEFLIDLSTLTTAADSEFGDTNTATVGTIDSTAQLFLQTTIAFSVASASNVATQRQLIAETVN